MTNKEYQFAKRCFAFLEDLEKAGLIDRVYQSELTWEDQAIATLKRRAGLGRLSDAEPCEKKFAAIVYKHFPECA